MRLKAGIAASVFFITPVLSGSPAIALDPIPKRSGFSGYIQPGAGYLSIKSNTLAKVLNFDLSDQRIGDLDDESDSQSTAIFTDPTSCPTRLPLCAPSCS